MRFRLGAIIVGLLSSIGGCAHYTGLPELYRGAPSLTPYTNSSWVRMHFSPSVSDEAVEVGDIHSAEQVYRMLGILSRYDGRWEPDPNAPSSLAGRLSAGDSNGPNQTIWFRPPTDDTPARLQTTIAWRKCAVDMSPEDFAELLTAAGAPVADAEGRLLSIAERLEPVTSGAGSGRPR